MRLLTLLVIGLFTVHIASARPSLATDLALVLLNDVSSSMDDREYALVKEGYRAAFSDPDVLAAILGNGKGVTVSYVEFSGKSEIMLVQGWDLITDEASARAFGEAIANAPRTSAGNTALSAGLASAAQLLMDGDFGTARQVIDVASDHPHDGGRSAAIRDAAVAAGITINALPIIDDRPIGTIDGRLAYSTATWGAGSVADFYMRDVIGGIGSFVVEARDFMDFGNALKRKLLLELIASGGEDEPVERT